MGENDFTQLLRLQSPGYRNAGDGDYFGAGIAYHVCSQHATVSSRGKYLAESLSPLVLRHEAARVSHWKLHHLYINSSGRGFSFGKPNSGHFGIGIDYAGDGIVMHLLILAEDVSDSHFRLMRSCMCKHREACHIACRIDSGDAGTHVGIHLDTAGAAGRSDGEFDTQILQTIAIKNGFSACRDEDFVAVCATYLPFGILIDHVSVLHRDYFAAKMEFDTFLLILSHEHSGYLVIHGTEKLGHHLYDGDLGAEGVQKADELHPYHTATNHNYLRRDFCHSEGFAAGDNRGAETLTESGDWRDDGFGAGAYQQVAANEGLLAAAKLHAAVFAALDEGFSADDLNSCLAHTHLDAACKLADHLLLALHNSGEVRRSTFYIYAVTVAMAGVVEQLGAVQQRLGGDTTFAEADSAKLFFLEKYNFETGLAGFLSCGVPPGATAYYRQIVHTANLVIILTFVYMKINFIIAAIVATLMGAASLSAQTPEEIVSKMSEQLARCEKEGVEMDLVMKMPIIGEIRTHNLAIGDKVRSEIASKEKSVVIWTDGITQWTYDKTKDELTIESEKPEVKESSSESNSDLDMFDGITDGYDLKIEKEDANAWYILCKKSKANKDKDAPKKMDLAVAKGSYLPIYLRMKESMITVSLENVKPGVAEADITFNPADYPNATIIDKRQ